MQHKDTEVRKAIIRLNDALCTWERVTNLESVLIIREQGGFVHRATSGKPLQHDDGRIVDAQLVKNIMG